MLSKSIVAHPVNTRNFTPSITAIPATCTFKLRSSDGPVNLVTTSASQSLSRSVLKTIDGVQVKVTMNSGKSFGVWINDPNCGQIKLGVTSIQDGLDEIVLSPIDFSKYGDFVLSFFQEDAGNESLGNKMPEFQVLLQVNDGGIDEFLAIP